MKNGTSQAVLVHDLFSGDGPYLSIADDFIAECCTRCGAPVDDDVRFTAAGYVCSACQNLGVT